MIDVLLVTGLGALFGLGAIGVVDIARTTMKMIRGKR